ncbi:MAG: ATP-binding protein [Planctomycetota bacterium]
MAIALGYIILGLLGRWTAVPPGFSSPLWPAAGWALVAALKWGPWALPGVWLGHASINALITLDLGIPVDPFNCLLFSALMGCGGVFSAGGASLLLRKLDLWPNPLHDFGKILPFLFIAGPLGCLLSATWGVGLLSIRGIIASPDIQWNFTTWWVGDSLGVLCLAPPLITWLWGNDFHWRGRKSLVTIPMVLVLVGSLVVFLMASKAEENRLRQLVDEKCRRVVKDIDSVLLQAQSHLEGLRMFYLSSQEVDPEEFETYTSEALNDHPFIRAFEWVPRVPRDGHETYPITYVNPIINNQKALGYDMSAEPVRRAMLESARTRHEPTLSDPIQLVQDGTPAFLAAHLIDGPGHIRGYVLMLLAIERLIDKALEGTDRNLFYLTLDVGGQSIHQDPRAASDSLSSFCHSLESHQTVESMGKTFSFRIEPSPAFILRYRTWQPWALMAGGGCLASLFGAALLRLSGQGLLVEQMVTSRTRELVAARAQAERAARSKMDFLANMSHEVRTPMNAILGMSDMLAESPLNEEQRNYVSVFRRAGEDLLELINDILDMARVEGGSLTLNPQSFNLRECIASAMALMRPKALKKGLVITHHVEAGVPEWVLGDPLRLRQILLNLLGNAIKFTERGAVKLHVEPESGSPRLHFSIQDTGVGFDPREASRLFTRFSQLDSHSSDQRGSSGLGLAICSHLVDLMQGRIWAESAKQLGSTFHFTALLPLTSKPQETEKPESAVPTATRELGRSLRILVAEDNEDNRLLVQALLKGFPVDLTFAFDGLKAVEAAQTSFFDMIFMDIQMPVLDGLSATRRLRSIEAESKKARIPIVALTAHAMETSLNDSIAAGCDAHLTKPVSREQILASILQHTGVALQRFESSPAPMARPEVEGIADLVPTFLGNRRKEIPVLRDHLAARRLPDIAKIAHNLKGLGAGYGFPSISDLGRRLETAAKADDPAACGKFVEELAAYLDTISPVSS